MTEPWNFFKQNLDRLGGKTMKVTWMGDELRPGIYLIPKRSVFCPNLKKNEVPLGKLESRWRRNQEKQDYMLFIIFENPQIILWYDRLDFSLEVFRQILT